MKNTEIDKGVQDILNEKLKEENMKIWRKESDILQGADQQKFLDNLKSIY